MEIREEQPEHEPAVRRLHAAAFGEGHGRVVADLVDGLRRAATTGDALSLVALDADAVVGHALFTRSLLDAPARLVEVQVLSPLGVLPERQGQGIGSALVERGLELLDRRGVPVVFLEGSPTYYARFGFEPGAGRGFRKPSLRIPDGAFQVRRLSTWEAGMTGTLVYAETFWQHDVVGLREG